MTERVLGTVVGCIAVAFAWAYIQARERLT